MTALTVTLPDGWVTADKFEQALLQQIASTSFESSTAVTFYISPSCKVMVEAAVRLLSLANQLAALGRSVTLAFLGNQNDAMSWLNRANFFAMLPEQVCVLPHRPDTTIAQRRQGQSKNLVEFRSIGSSYDKESIQPLPSQLADALGAVVETYPGHLGFRDAAFLIFGELITNVYDHSQTALDGFVAMQVYPQGNKVQVVVSDSGIGLLETLRAKVSAPLSDVDLLRSLFHGSLTWHETRGIGLSGCAKKALNYQGSVGIRLATCSIVLHPVSGSYQRAQIYSHYDLIRIEGTHICFSFPLDISS